MDRSPSIEIKESLLERYAREGNIEDSVRILEKGFQEPLFCAVEHHPEEEPNLKEINQLLEEMVLDIKGLDQEFALSSERLESLISSSKERMKRVDRDIALEEERLNDVNMLCGIDSSFGNVRLLTEEDFEGTASFVDEAFESEIDRESLASLEVLKIEGNGYEGNEYVISGNRFLVDSVNTGDKRFLVDNKVSTVFEYSRLNASPKEKHPFALLNYDGNEAECTITLSSNREVSSIKLDSYDEDLQVTYLSVSDDNITYREVLTGPLLLNNKKEQYLFKNRYVYGTGVLAFPSSKYIKVGLKSSGHTEDKIAFVRVVNSMVKSPDKVVEEEPEYVTPV